MQEAFKRGSGKLRIAAEGVVPLRKRQLGYQIRRATPLISPGNDTEEMAGLVADERQVANFHQ